MKSEKAKQSKSATDALFKKKKISKTQTFPRWVGNERSISECVISRLQK